MALGPLSLKRKSRLNDRSISSLSRPPSFIKCLPPDILLKIFMLCVPVHKDEYIIESALSAREAPVVLGRVCSLWRTVVLSIPSLWSNVHYHFPSSVHDFSLRRIPKKIGKILKSIQVQMELSKSSPLDILLTGFDVDKKFIDRALAILMPHVKRWRSICLYLDMPRSIARTLFEGIGSGAPSLEYFEYIIGDILDDRSSSEPLIANFSRAPFLQKIKIAKNQMEKITNIEGPKHAHHLAICSADVDMFFRAIEVFPCASYLDFEYTDDNYTGPKLAKGMLHTINIRTLKLRVRESSKLENILLNNVNFPCLEELILHYWTNLALPKLISQSGYSLKKLALDTCPTYRDFLFDRDILPVLEHSPFLQELQIIGNVDASVFMGLSKMSSNPAGYAEAAILCPELVRLKLSARNSVDYRSLQAMITVRSALACANVRDRTPKKGLITLIGNMEDLSAHPRVLDCFRRFGVQCALQPWDTPTQVDDYLETLPRNLEIAKMIHMLGHR